MAGPEENETSLPSTLSVPGRFRKPPVPQGERIDEVGVTEAMSSRPPSDAPADASQLSPGDDDGVRPPVVSMLFMVLFPFLIVLALMVLDGWVRRGTP